MSDILERILTRKHDEIAALRRSHSRAALDELAAQQAPVRGFAAALRTRAQTGAAVIAEIKKASPSRGLIRAEFDPAWIAREYESAGAACLSVLTDRDFFQGSDQHLQSARDACALPVIRKDFLIDELQIAQARAIGADCVLLIAAALSVAQLRELHAGARSRDLDVLVEIHDAGELDQVMRADLAGGFLLGINNRDLRNFETRLETTLNLLSALPASAEVVSESGINTRVDIERMQAAGVERFLIGESLMRQASPGAALRALLGTAL